jgi:serine/threonine-protein kinase
VIVAAVIMLLPGRNTSDTAPVTAQRYVLGNADLESGSTPVTLARRILRRVHRVRRRHPAFVPPQPASFDVTPISGTEEGSAPFFSPDGAWIGFCTNTAIKKVPAGGGVAQVVASEARVGSAEWGRDAMIYYCPRDGGEGAVALMRVPASGGASQAVAFLDTTAAEAEAWLPEILPDGKTVLISVSGGAVSWHIDAIKPDGSRVMLVENALLARYAPGYLVYQDLSSQAVLCAPFDADRLAFTGPAVPLTDPVDANHAFDIDAHGTLVYVPVMGANAGSEVVWLDRNGAASLVTETRGTWASPRVSSDGKRVLLRKTLVNCELWMYDVESGALGRIVQGPDSHDPIWGPDGRRIVYSQANAGGKTVTQTVDGTREVRDVPVGDQRARAQSWSGGNNVLAYTAPGRGTRSDIWTLAMDGAAKPALFLATPFEETVPDISPDGRFIAYVSDESGAAEVFVRPYPSADQAWQISVGGGASPLWSRDGRELFFVSGTRMMAVAVDTGTGFRAGKAVELFSGGFNTARARDFDVAPDGRFVAIRVPGGGAGQREIRVVLNWPQELKRVEGSGD